MFIEALSCDGDVIIVQWLAEICTYIAMFGLVISIGKLLVPEAAPPI